MTSFICTFLLVVTLLPLGNLAAAHPVDEKKEKVVLTEVEKKEYKRKRVRRVLMTNKVIEYKKTFYIT